VPGTTAHTWQAVAAGGTSIGKKGMINAAKILSLTALDIFNNPALAKTAKEELLKMRGADFKYEALLGNRKPPLNYRD
jgi:aminobenzoyl-glutamate utilization protein B